MDKVTKKLDELEGRLKDSFGIGTVLRDDELKALIKIARTAEKLSNTRMGRDAYTCRLPYYFDDMQEALKELGDL